MFFLEPVAYPGAFLRYYPPKKIASSAMSGKVIERGLESNGCKQSLWACEVVGILTFYDYILGLLLLVFMCSSILLLNSVLQFCF